jgi:hypothetical protein
VSTRDLHVVRNGDRWEPEWPIVKEPIVPPQVIAVNYLRWDVIYRGPGMTGVPRMWKRLTCALWTCTLWNGLMAW